MIKLDVQIGDIILMGRFKNKKVKVKTIDYDERIKMYDNVQDILVNKMPWIPIVQPEFNILHKNTIHGFNWEARLSGYPRYSDLIFQKNNN